MEPSLTWLDLTARDREKMRRVVDLFSEQGTLDEMGLGSIRDAISDALFPGTSSIQTRLRYFLFIPWIYLSLEGRHLHDAQIAESARQAELALITPLTQSDDADGVIGGHARNTLVRLPSDVYWAGLVRWGIFQFPQSRSWLHAHFDEVRTGRGAAGHADDPGVVWQKRPAWHARLPKPPDGFPAHADFKLRTDEAGFLRGRLEEHCAGSLLAWLAREGSSMPADHFWDEPSIHNADPTLQGTVELARRFSLHVEGLPLLYNLLLAERRHAYQGNDTERIERYRNEVAEWAAREAAESQFDSASLWAFMARRGSRVVDSQRRFVESWTRRLAEVGVAHLVDDQTVRLNIEERELKLKGPSRARLRNKGRLLDWSGRTGIGRMDFRWFRVRQQLIDLHQGLES